MSLILMNGISLAHPLAQREAALPQFMYHWTEARNAPWIGDEGLDPGTYLTVDHDVNQLNPDIPQMEIPFRLTVDTRYLQPELFGVSDAGEGYPGSIEHNLNAHGNLYYNGQIPPRAIVDMQKMKPQAPRNDFEFAL